MQHLNEEFEMPTPPFERNPAEALVMATEELPHPMATASSQK